MGNNKIEKLDIFKESNFFIDYLDNDMYVFYNSTQHFACKLSKTELLIFNLIYKYKELNTILPHIDTEFHNQIKEIHQKTIASKALMLDSKNNPKIKYQLPTSFYLHLTYKCNLRCTYCYNKEIRTDFQNLNTSDWIHIIDKIMLLADRIILTGGEPFLFPNIQDIIQYIRNKSKTIHIEIISNCMIDFKNHKYIDEIFNNINSITFSCDNLSNKNQTRENFDPIRFKDNIKYIKEHYPLVYIIISSIYIKDSHKEYQLIKEFCHQTNIAFKSVLVTPNNKEDITLLPNIKDYKKTLTDNKTKLKPIRRFCGAGIGSCSIDPKGNVYPCQSLHYPQFYYGNLFQDTLLNILEQKISQYVRSQYNVDLIETCKDCCFKYICGAGCRAATYKLEGDPTKYPKTLCLYYKELSIHKLKSIPFNNL